MVVLGPEEETNGCPNCGIPVYQAEALLAGKGIYTAGQKTDFVAGLTL